MSRANIFSFFSKKKFLSDKGRKGNFFLWDFLLLQMCGIIIFVFFLLFSLSFRIQLCMQQLTQKIVTAAAFSFYFFHQVFMFQVFLKENFSAFFGFIHFFVCFCFKIFLCFHRFFSQRGGRRQLEVDFFSELAQENHIKDYKKQID